MKSTILTVIGIMFLCLNAFSQESDSSTAKTTLDSLQGVWHLKDDENSQLRIMNDTVLYISENKIVDGGILYINGNSFLDSANINNGSVGGGNSNGRFLTVQSGVFRYYEIKSVSATELVLLKEGVIFNYIKEEE